MAMDMGPFIIAMDQNPFGKHKIMKHPIKTLLFPFLSIFLMTNMAQAVFVLPPAPSSNIGGEIGRGFGNGLNRGFEMAWADGAQERERKRIQKAQEKQLAKEKEILKEILTDYTPSETPKYVVKVIKSDLSSSSKEFVINALNEQYALYVKEQGLWYRIKKFLFD